MWKTFFFLCDFLARLIPHRKVRERVRRVNLFDFYAKYRALRNAFPDLDFRHAKMVKGGWNIGFIVDRKYVFKIRKNFDKNAPTAKIVRESRLTHALAPYANIRIPCVDIVDVGEYTFIRYDFIPGKNLNKFPLRTIRKYADVWGHTVAGFIHDIHNARPVDIDDLRTGDGDGWNHNDICNNIIVNPNTMQIVGIIDWEYAGWGTLAHEFKITTAYSSKMRKSGIGAVIRREYEKIDNR